MLIRSHLVTNSIEVSIDVYANWAFFNSLLEIIKEALVFPLFWWIGIEATNKQKTASKIKKVYLFIFIIYTIVIICFLPFTNQFLNVINADKAKEQNRFFRLMLISKIPQILLLISLVTLITYDKYLIVLILTIIEMIVGISLDYLLGITLLFDLGMTGVGLSSILTKSIIFLFLIIFVINIFGMKDFFKKDSTKFMPSSFWKVSGYSAIDSLIRNFFYVFFIGALVNSISEAGSYWIATSIYWSWILLPVLVLADVHKSSTSLVAKDKEEVKIVLFQHEIVSIVLYLIMVFISFFLWKPLALFMSSDPIVVEQTWNIFLMMIIFYFFFAVSSVADSVFFGMGRTERIAIQSVIVNFCIYVPYIIVYSLGIWIPNLVSICLMFGIAMFCDAIITYFVLFIWLKKFSYRKINEYDNI